MAFLVTETVPCESESEPGSKERDDVRVDHSTLQMIAHIFPAPTLGQIFFARFLERAAREKSIIPDVASDMVYICTKSIATLGKELGLSNDTAQKYVVLYKALGLLQKRKVMDQLVFVLSTGIYHPPENLEANLDYLIQKSRPKLRTMAVDVKARCQVYGLISQDIIASFQQLNALLQAEKGDPKHALEQRMAQGQQIVSRLFGQVMTLHLSQAQAQVDSPRSLLPTKEGREQVEKATESTSSRRPGRHQMEKPPQNLLPVMPEVDAERARQAAESTRSDTPGRRDMGIAPLNLPGEACPVDADHEEHTAESTQTGVPGRRSIEKTSANLSDVAYQVDSQQARREKESPQRAISGRFLQKNASSYPLKETPVGDSEVTEREEKAIESTRGKELGRFDEDHIRSNLPDLPGRVDSGGGSRNVYVITIYDFITTYTLREPRRVAEFFAEQFERDRRVYPKYLKLFHTENGQARDPHILAAAFICTMVRLYRDKWNISNRPGGFFTNRCREYDAGVPEDVEEWIKSYGHLSRPDLLEALTKQASVPITPAAVPYRKPAPAPLPPLRIDASVQVEPARAVMSESEAQALVEAIKRNDRTRLLRARRIRLGKETPRYAVLVDASMPDGPPRQAVVYSADEWQAYLDTKKSWRDLIYLDASSQTQERDK